MLKNNRGVEGADYGYSIQEHKQEVIMDNHFIQSVFIRKNTPDLRKKLEELGYKSLNSGNTTLDAHNFDGHGNHKHIDEGNAIITSKGDYYGVIYIIDDVTRKGRIDCGTNEYLFLALAALRDDCDYMQWFTDGENRWFKCRSEHRDPMLSINAFDIGYRKATAEELIKYFEEKR